MCSCERQRAERGYQTRTLALAATKDIRSLALAATEDIHSLALAATKYIHSLALVATSIRSFAAINLQVSW
jgi:hypothetical protein